MDPLSIGASIVTTLADPLRIGASIVTTITGAAVSTAWAAAKLRAWRKDQEGFAILRKVLLADLGRGQTAYMSDNVHELYRKGAPSPDNSVALRSIAGKRYSEAEALGRLVISELDAIPTNVDRDLVLIGSPTSEGLSRRIFDYREEETGSLVFEGSAIDLPYYWDLRVDPKAPTTRRYIDGQMVERQNWFLRGNEGGRPRLLIPSVDPETRLLLKDYLLITRLRNFLHDYRSGYYIVNLGGTHGTGTRAVPLVLRSKSLAREIIDKLGETCTTLQAVVEVTTKHDHLRRVSKPVAVSVVYVTTLPDDDAVWSYARRTIMETLRASGGAVSHPVLQPSHGPSASELTTRSIFASEPDTNRRT